MGFVRKLTGADAAGKAANRNADATIAATQQAAADAQQQLMATAKASADQQSQIAARQAAEDQAADIASKPLDVAEVALDPVATESASATRRTRKASFGRNYTGGVGI